MKCVHNASRSAVTPSKRFQGATARFLVLVLLAHASLVSAAPWKFLVAGDSISLAPDMPVNTNILSEIGRAITNEKPAFVLFSGDYAYTGTLTNFGLWTNTLAPVYEAGIPVYAALGNHDLGDLASFTAVFGSTAPDNGPEGEKDLTFAIAYSNALVLVLDVYNFTNALRVNQDWVDAVLATNTAPHVFALGHAPAFRQAHIDCLDNYAPERDRFWNSLSNAHARVYFSGHDHFYDHARIDDCDGNPENDLHQIVVGTSGAPFYGEAPYDGANSLWTPERSFHAAQYGYVRVEVNEDKAQTTWVHRTSTGTYEPGGDVFGWSVLPRPVLHVERRVDGAVLIWSGDGQLEAAPSLHAGFTNVPFATSPFALTDLPGRSLFYRLRR